MNNDFSEKVFVVIIKIISTHLHLVFCSQNFAIKKRPQNLMDIQLQTIYAHVLFTYAWPIDQLKHILIDVFYKWNGPDVTFNIWMLGFLIESLG